MDKKLSKYEADFLAKTKEFKYVCVFPFGLHGRSIARNLLSFGCEIDFFCDNNKEKWGKESLSNDESRGKSLICQPLSYLLERKEQTLIVLASNFQAEIQKGLEAEGCENFTTFFHYQGENQRFLEEQGDKFPEMVEELKGILSDEKSSTVVDILLKQWQSDEVNLAEIERIYDKNQYFSNDVFTLTEYESFVDCGAYTGDTAELFLEATGEKFQALHLFEMDPVIYEKCQENMGKVAGKEKIHLYNYGVWKEKDSFTFTAGDSDSAVAQNGTGDTVASLDKLDSLLEGERVTFIKMDIEGAEIPALLGAKQLIQSQKPRLAICIYHSPEDFFQIPHLLNQWVPEYKIAIRHHTALMYETVCYAWVET